MLITNKWGTYSILFPHLKIVVLRIKNQTMVGHGHFHGVHMSIILLEKKPILILQDEMEWSVMASNSKHPSFSPFGNHFSDNLKIG